MNITKNAVVVIANDMDVVHARKVVRNWAIEQGFKLIDQTKIVTAASELARNTLIYGGGGNMTLDLVEDGPRRGIRLVFQDSGPGIPDIKQALQDGYTSGSGLGMGLGGSKRLMSEFEIESRVGEGTRITATRWK